MIVIIQLVSAHSTHSLGLQLLVLPKVLQVVDVAVEGLPRGVHIVVLDTKLLAGLPDNGRDEGVVRLNDAREEMVGRLVVECSSEDAPEPAVCGVVQCCGHLHLCPAKKKKRKEGRMHTDRHRLLYTNQSLWKMLSSVGLNHSTCSR